jgi:hypothetical protein
MAGFIRSAPIVWFLLALAIWTLSIISCQLLILPGLHSRPATSFENNLRFYQPPIGGSVPIISNGKVEASYFK